MSGSRKGRGRDRSDSRRKDAMHASAARRRDFSGTDMAARMRQAAYMGPDQGEPWRIHRAAYAISEAQGCMQNAAVLGTSAMNA